MDIKYSPKYNLAYLHNPKVGCSSIKNSLLDGLVSNVHEQNIFPVFNNPHADIFSVVRNPYNRIVSAYLDKIGPKKDDWVWLPFCNKYKLDPELEISFQSFLKVLSYDSQEYDIDPHFRPQYYNLGIDKIKPSFIGFLENMEPVKEYLFAHGVKFLDNRPHTTQGKVDISKFITLQDKIIIDEIYDLDFIEFGYEKRIRGNNSYNYQPIQNQQSISSELIFQHQKVKNDDIVSALHNLVLNHNEDNVIEALKVLVRLRPDNKFYRDKLSRF